jgi:hypothetical protein
MIVLWLCMVSGVGMICHATVQGSFSVYTSVLCSVLCVALAFFMTTRRRDRAFIKLLGFCNLQRLLVVENVLLVAPFLIALLFSPYPLLVLPVVFGIGAIGLMQMPSFTQISSAGVQQRLSLLSMTGSFEVASGVRRYWLIFVVIVPLACILSKIIVAVPMAMLLVGTAIPSFHDMCEPRYFIESTSLSPPLFLWLKIRQSVGFFVAICLVLTGCFCIFYSAMWYIPVGIGIVCSIAISIAVISKYASYLESRNVAFINMITVLLIIVAIVIPPFAIILLWRLWKKAVHNVSSYIYAFSA